jgi:hypothetical protein
MYLYVFSLYQLKAVCLGESVDYILYGNPENTDVNSSRDRLGILVEKIPSKKREAVADIIQAALPHLK